MGWNGSLSWRLFSGSLSRGISSSVAAKPAGNAAAGKGSDGPPRSLDRAKDRGDHHADRAGDAKR